MPDLDTELGAQVESKTQIKPCMEDPILLINLILFSSLEDVQWCTNWVLKAIRISVNVSKQIKQTPEWFLRENKFQLCQHRVTDPCQDYHNNIIAQKPVKNN